MRTRDAARKSGGRAVVLDAATQARRKVLEKMQGWSSKQLFDLAVRAGIYEENGKLAAPYRGDADPSGSRPKD